MVARVGAETLVLHAACIQAHLRSHPPQQHRSESALQGPRRARGLARACVTATWPTTLTSSWRRMSSSGVCASGLMPTCMPAPPLGARACWQQNRGRARHSCSRV